MWVTSAPLQTTCCPLHKSSRIMSERWEAWQEGVWPASNWAPWRDGVTPIGPKTRTRPLKCSTLFFIAWLCDFFTIRWGFPIGTTWWCMIAMRSLVCFHLLGCGGCLGWVLPHGPPAWTTYMVLDGCDVVDSVEGECPHMDGNGYMQALCRLADLQAWHQGRGKCFLEISLACYPAFLPWEATARM